jgi:hypothetical protein
MDDYWKTRDAKHGVLPSLALPSPAFHFLFFFCPTLSCFVLSYLVLPCLVFSSLVPYLVHLIDFPLLHLCLKPTSTLNPSETLTPTLTLPSTDDKKEEKAPVKDQNEEDTKAEDQE